MKRLLILALAAAGPLCLIACKKHVVEVSTTAYIIGPVNDIRGAAPSEPEVGDKPLNAAVLVSTRLADKRVKFCSGTLVLPEAGKAGFRILTNHHCFAETGPDGKATKNLLLEACSFTTVYFGYLAGQAKDAVAIGCEAGTLRTSFAGDLAVLTLAQNPPDKFQPLALWDGEEAPVGRAAAIVHYPDVDSQLESTTPGGVRLPTAAVTLTDCKVVGLFDQGEWDLDRTLPFSLRHTCDLIHGSSGSGLIDLQTGTLLGVNWGGIKITYADGVRVDNVATRASFARAFLEGREADAVRVTGTDTRPGQGSAVGSPHKDGDGAAEKKENLGQSLKKRTCGTLGREASSATFATHGLLLVLLFGPLAVFLLPRKRA